jgi:undecaprenyl-diphosphatase
LSAEAPTLEERLLRCARTRGHTPGRERAVARFSALGEHGAIWLALGAAGAALGGERAPAFRRAARLVVLAHLLNSAVKLIVGRRRPQLAGLAPLTATPTRLSFPSAHATTGFAGAPALSHAGLPAAPMYGLAAALALSRIYLGVHYPSDVLAGAALGTLVSGAALHGPGRAEGARRRAGARQPR